MMVVCGTNVATASGRTVDRGLSLSVKLSQTGVIGGHLTVMMTCLFGVVHEMTTRSIGTETDAVKGAAQLRLVFGMTL